MALAAARRVEMEVLSERVPPALDGLRIGHLSDLDVRGGVFPRMLHAPLGGALLFLRSVNVLPGPLHPAPASAMERPAAQS